MSEKVNIFDIELMYRAYAATAPSEQAIFKGMADEINQLITKKVAEAYEAGYIKGQEVGITTLAKQFGMQVSVGDGEK